MWKIFPDFRESNFISATEIKLGEKNCCQLIAPLFMKYSLNSSQISFVSIAASLPHLGLCSMSPIWFILLNIQVLDLLYYFLHQ